MQLNLSYHAFKTFVDPLHWWDHTEERAQVSFIGQQCDEKTWNEAAKIMRAQPTIRKWVDILSVIKCGNQVDGDKIFAGKDAVFEDYEDDALGGKLSKDSPVWGEHGGPKVGGLKGAQARTILSLRRKK